MNETKNRPVGKMQELRITVEHIHTYRYQGRKICLSKVPFWIKTRNKSSKRRSYRIWFGILNLVNAICVAGVVYCILAPMALKERGYVAYGSECLVALAAGGVMYWILERMVKNGT